MDIAKIQILLQEAELDGWLFTDFQGHDFITKEFLELGNRFCTRRMFYLIPTQGEPVKVLSAISRISLIIFWERKCYIMELKDRRKCCQNY